MSAANRTTTSSEHNSEYVLIHDVNGRKKSSSRRINEAGREKRDMPTITKRHEPEGRTNNPPLRRTETHERIIPASVIRPLRRLAVTFENPLPTAKKSAKSGTTTTSNLSAAFRGVGNEGGSSADAAAAAADDAKYKDDDEEADWVVVEKRIVSVDWPASWNNEFDGIQLHEELRFKENWF